MHLSRSSRNITKRSDLYARRGFVATTAPESPHPIDVEAEDQRIVEEESTRYLADGIITDEEELADFDLSYCFCYITQACRRAAFHSSL